ncbi:hypothetical protein DPMN_168258 [Dreissena polymorpha]|uniref:Uncharacterized protein n=1 Tax=Dreissena polymorpha TaxID=45954 RepID=A0A9D4F2Z0_DREPO|nr:hypothetical protein DPMN_168258 [Dreissena polymorpha]
MDELLELGWYQIRCKYCENYAVTRSDVSIVRTRLVPDQMDELLELGWYQIRCKYCENKAGTRSDVCTVRTRLVPD